ncbi:MAG TPA: hypothetical protein VEI97_19040, partial [bacterium]|nr:hypothetical protein [bacterium]
MAISPPSIRRLTREDPGGLALLRRHRRVTLLGAGAAVLLGLTGGALGYRLGAGAGAAVAITLAVLPLLLLFLWRIPLAYLTTTFLLLGLNCFAFLIDEALVYRGMAAVLLLLTIVRFGRLDLQRTGTYNACLLLMALAAAGHLVFHRSLWSAANIG